MSKKLKVVLLTDNTLLWSVGKDHDHIWSEDGKITGARITSGATVSYVTDALTKHLTTEDKILAYCIDRVLRYHQIYKTSHYEPRIQPDYYGATVYASLSEWDYIDGINNDIKTLYSLNDTQRIEFVLTQEYGYVLDHIRDKFWQVVTVPTKRIEMHNESYLTKVLKEDRDIYNDNYNLPIGIYKPFFDSKALQQNTPTPKYRIIDGYHRYVVNANKKEVEIITYLTT